MFWISQTYNGMTIKSCAPTYSGLIAIVSEDNDGAEIEVEETDDGDVLKFRDGPMIAYVHRGNPYGVSK